MSELLEQREIMKKKQEKRKKDRGNNECELRERERGRETRIMKEKGESK